MSSGCLSFAVLSHFSSDDGGAVGRHLLGDEICSETRSARRRAGWAGCIFYGPLPACQRSLAPDGVCLLPDRLPYGNRSGWLYKAVTRTEAAPSIPEDTQAKVQEPYAQDVSINQIAKRLDIAYGTAWNYAQEVKSN